MSPGKREAILRAAEEMAKDRRFHEVTMEEVARAAHVSKGSIYTYFRDKDDLFFHLATDGFDELCELIRAGAREEAPFEKRLLAVCTGISSFFAGRRHLMRVAHENDGRLPALGGEARRRWRAKRGELIGAVAELLADGVRQSRLRDDVSPGDQAALLLGMMRSRSRPPHGEERESLSIEVVIDVFMNGSGLRTG
ncbi:MAG: TetR/AcrR family transcriptional regulator [Planctomycetota bacterium]|jgi:AcrR family transcriptional regulator